MAVTNYIIYFLIPVILAFDSCKQHKYCNDCIRDTSKCAFCSTDNFNGTRCISKIDISDNWCSANDIINPKSTVTSTKDLEFNSKIKQVIQMKPQNIKIDMRIGESVDFKFSFKKADNYPVDLYFLFDGSSSMEKLKNKTAAQSENIYRMMQNMTKNVLLGMGTYVDKNALPYTQFKNSTLAYSFRNRLKLTDKFEVFQKIVSESEFGGNYDVPEGTLDALAQVITCKDIIGWRNESRKIIVVLTDQSYHAAGDGKWAGIFQPYDGKCYTENDIYTKELEMDYPSVGIINKLAVDDAIRVMFVVGSSVQNNYDALSKNIEGSKYTTHDGKDIVTIIKNMYNEITQNLKLKVKNNYSDSLKISFEPDCYKSKTSKKCKVMQGDEKNFTGTIKLIKYFDAKDIKIDVMFEGIKEDLELNINLLGDCDCKTEVNSSICNFGGTRRCGVCECYSERNGDFCSNPNDNSTCIAPLDTVLCSGHGSCFHGQCLCREGYENTYCECIKDSCKLGSNGNMCSYPNGVCDCGVCKCTPEWTGSTCGCPSETDCTDGNGICNNRGYCKCGKCKCLPKADWDVRTEETKYCKLSCKDDACYEKQCLDLEPIAINYLKEEDIGYKNVIISKEKNLTSYNDSDWIQCPKLRYDVGCYTRFVYRYVDDRYEIEVKIQSDPDCAETYYYIGGSCLALLLLIGIVTLVVWKYLTDRQDRREYERFLKEASTMSSAWDNPIYGSPTTTFHNPAFGKSNLPWHRPRGREDGLPVGISRKDRWLTEL